MRGGFSKVYSLQWNLKAASNSEQSIEKSSFALKFPAVKISQLLWLIYLFGTLRLMINQKPEDTQAPQECALSEICSVISFISAGSGWDCRHPAPLYPDTPYQDIVIISTQVVAGGGLWWVGVGKQFSLLTKSFQKEIINDCSCRPGGGCFDREGLTMKIYKTFNCL